MTPPHDTASELALLGALIVDYAKPGAVAGHVQPEDFYAPAHAALYAAILDLHRAGVRPEGVVLADELRRTGAPVPRQTIIEAQAAAEVGVDRLAATIVRLAVSRKVMAVAAEIGTVAGDGNTDPAELIATARELVAAIDSPIPDAATDKALTTVDDFLATASLTPSPWTVPGLLRTGWRAMVVAPEGAGKSMISRQMAIAAAQGIHPFTHRPTNPVRTLIVDLENPDDAIAEGCKPITTQARRAAASYDEGRAWLWRRPAGLDIRGRTDRAALEKVIGATGPDLVVLGPLYKAYRATARENDELAAGEVQSVLDDLRTRHSFALLMEHHAPKSSGLAPRDLVPYGSSLWLRWPELGLRLTPGDGERAPADSLVVGRFRRDRMTNAWPDRLDRGGPSRWPWVGYWRDGMSVDL